jgi:hypothetical protein
MDASVPPTGLYRAHASECLQEALATEDREFKEVYHRLAVWWVILAHEVEDESRLISLPLKRPVINGWRSFNALVLSTCDSVGPALRQGRARALISHLFAA